MLNWYGNASDFENSEIQLPAGISVPEKTKRIVIFQVKT